MDRQQGTSAQPVTAATTELRVPNQEVEKKWLIQGELPDLNGIKGKEVFQGYIAVTSDGPEVRVRQKGEKYFQTIKSDGDLVRDEIEIELTKDQFDNLWPATAGKRLEKTRYEIKYGDATIELDVYKGNLESLTVAEVEFSSVRDSETFSPPSWFGEEVTKDKRFKNKNLATKGIPQLEALLEKVSAPSATTSPAVGEIKTIDNHQAVVGQITVNGQPQSSSIPLLDPRTTGVLQSITQNVARMATSGTRQSWFIKVEKDRPLPVLGLLKEHFQTRTDLAENIIIAPISYEEAKHGFAGILGGLCLHLNTQFPEKLPSQMLTLMQQDLQNGTHYVGRALSSLFEGKLVILMIENVDKLVPLWEKLDEKNPDIETNKLRAFLTTHTLAIVIATGSEMPSSRIFGYFRETLAR